MKKLHFVTHGARKGFTLLEALFAVLIIAILAAVAVPMYASTKSQSELKTCMSNVRAIESAEVKYALENGSYTKIGTDLIGQGVAQFPTCPKDGATYTIKDGTVAGSIDI